MKVPDWLKFTVGMIGIVVGCVVLVLSFPVIDVTLTQWNCYVFSQGGPAYYREITWWCEGKVPR